MNGSRVERRLAAIVSGDVAGYSRLIAEHEDSTVRTLRGYREQVSVLVGEHGGRLADFTGDAFLAEFPTALDATSFAVESQRVLAARNASQAEEHRIEFRLGVHLGDVRVEEGRLFGDGVNVAARLHSLAKPGGLCISDSVRREVVAKLPVEFEDLGVQELKNIPEPVRAFRARIAAEARPRRLGRKWPFAIAGALLVLAVVYGVREEITLMLLRSGWLRPGPIFEQEIAFATTSDGIRIAYASAGEGPPIVVVLGWFTHLERGASSPGWSVSPWITNLIEQHRVVQYDGRGTGLSDRGIADYSLAAKVRDLQAVIDASGLGRFALYGHSFGGATAIAYAARNPDRVTRIAFYGGFARLGAVPEYLDRWKRLVPLTRIGWGEDNPAFRQVFTSLFMPEADEFTMRVFNELQRVAATPDDAAAFMESLIETDVTDLAPKIRAPVLVVHRRGDAIVPFEMGREIAGLVPEARLLVLEGNSHMFLPGDPAYNRVADAMQEFFAEDL